MVTGHNAVERSLRPVSTGIHGRPLGTVAMVIQLVPTRVAANEYLNRYFALDKRRRHLCLQIELSINPPR